MIRKSTKDPIRLKYSYFFYRFAVWDPDPLLPELGPGIVLERIPDRLLIACTDYAGYIGAAPGDATYEQRTAAICDMLTHLLQHAKQLGITRLADVKPHQTALYLNFMCSEQAAEYAREFLWNLAAAGQLTYVSKEDIDIRI